MPSNRDAPKLREEPPDEDGFRRWSWLSPKTGHREFITQKPRHATIGWDAVNKEHYLIVPFTPLS